MGITIMCIWKRHKILKMFFKLILYSTYQGIINLEKVRGKHLLPCTWKLRQLSISARLKQTFVVVRYLLDIPPQRKF
jgi:hypothetical protein